MHHGMVIYRSENDLELARGLFQEGLARAFAGSYLSELKAFTMFSASTSTELASLSGPACPSNPADCIDLILEMFKGITSDHREEMTMVYAFLTIDPGRRREFQAHAEATTAPDGVRDAAAHAFGSEEVQAVVEVVGEVPHLVLQHLLALTDLPYISRVQTMFLAQGSTDGFGSGAARAD